jgi:hypothetical protein
MRRATWLAAALLGLALAAPAHAQRIATFGVTPGPIVNQPIDTSAAAIPIAQPMTVSHTFSLLNFSPHFPFPGAKPIHGTSQFPTPSQMPGAGYLKAFGFSRPSPLNP